MVNDLNMAAAAEVGARQTQGSSLGSSVQPAEQVDGAEVSFAVAMSNHRSGVAVGAPSSVTTATNVISMRVGESEVQTQEQGAPTNPLDEGTATHDTDGDGVLSQDELKAAITNGIGMGAATQVGRDAQRVVSEKMKRDGDFKSQVLNGGRKSSS
jgi:hypothetical protein